jgi:N utilization substance protein A
MASNPMPSGAELLGIIDMIHREKEIDKEILFQSLESAILTAARKKFGNSETLVVAIDRRTGEMSAYDDDHPIDANDLGRIAAQTAKQVFIQKMREAESDILYQEYITKREHLVFGTVKRFEAGAMIVDLGKAEGYIPRSEQVRSEHYHPGDRIRAYVTAVEKVGPKLRITMSRTHPNLVYCLFELEVPEVAEGVIEIVNLVREPGYRTKMLVRSHDAKVDSIGACLGVRGSRINSIRDEIGGEKVDIIPYTEDLERLVVEALKPAEVRRVEIDFELSRARVHVDEEFLSLAIGRKGLNVRLAARLCGLSINIVTTNTATKEEQLEYQVETEPVAVEPEIDTNEEIAEVEGEQPEDAPPEGAEPDAPKT